MMRILHVTPYYAPAWAYGGVVTAVTGLATAQAARGHQVTVLTTDALDFSASNPTRCETLDGVEVIRCHNLSSTVRARYNLSLPWGFRRAFRRLSSRAEIVHTHELRTVENLLMIMTSRNTSRCRIVLSPHGTLPYGTGRGGFKRGWDRLFGRWQLGRIAGIAGLTAAEVDDARALWSAFGVPFPTSAIIPNGVPADFAVSRDLRMRYQLGDGPVILFLGRLHERKGLQFLIPAFARAANEIPTARLLIAGPDAGMLTTAQRLAAQAGIASQVTFAGMLHGADQRAALATADLFVLPAVGEGLSMAVLEAMAAGIPVILTPGCNLPDVESRGAGLLVNREVEPLAAAIRDLLRDQVRRRAMGESGRAWVRESFTWPAIAAQTEPFYAAVAESQIVMK